MIPDRAATLTEAARLRSLFEAAGAQPVETAILQPAEALLDLYGEDIRARAYVTSDALRGEQMLRPDFTVPVVQMHMQHGTEPARYTYSGEVFRRQEEDPARANEYIQVGYEIFERDAPDAADAEVFSMVFNILRPLGLRAATGDIGILMAAVEGLRTTDRRKAALRRHIWRPRRFRALMERFSGRAPVPRRARRFWPPRTRWRRPVPMVGLRGPDEIQSRINALREDAATPPIARAEVELLDAILAVRETSDNALERLRDIAVDMEAIQPAVDASGAPARRAGGARDRHHRPRFRGQLRARPDGVL